MKRTLLIITSLPKIQQSLTEALNNDFSIKLLNNGIEALEWLEDENTADAILVDLKMKGISCVDFICAIRFSTVFRKTPVVLFSSGENGIEYLESGADEYISDPYNLQEVKVRVKNMYKKYSKTNTDKYCKVNTYTISGKSGFI